MQKKHSLLVSTMFKILPSALTGKNITENTDEICNACRIKIIRARNNNKSEHSIENLEDKILLKICNFLGTKDLITFSFCSKSFYNRVWGKNNNNLWKIKSKHYEHLYNKYKTEYNKLKTNNNILNIINKSTNHKIATLQKKYNNLQENSKETLIQYQNLTNIPQSNENLTKDQENLFRQFVAFKNTKSNDNIIEAKNI